jgi:hypothetical protein
MAKNNKLEFDFSELLGRIVAKYGSRSAFAKEMGMKETVLSGRLLCKTYFTPDEVLLACRLLGIQQNEIPRFFYTRKFHFSEQTT